MLDTRTFSYKKYLTEAVIALACVFIFCEYLLYYLVLIQVSRTNNKMIIKIKNFICCI